MTRTAPVTGGSRGRSAAAASFINGATRSANGATRSANGAQFFS